MLGNAGVWARGKWLGYRRGCWEIPTAPGANRLPTPRGGWAPASTTQVGLRVVLE